MMFLSLNKRQQTGCSQGPRYLAIVSDPERDFQNISVKGEKGSRLTSGHEAPTASPVTGRVPTGTVWPSRQAGTRCTAIPPAAVSAVEPARMLLADFISRPAELEFQRRDQDLCGPFMRGDPAGTRPAQALPPQCGSLCREGPLRTVVTSMGDCKQEEGRTLARCAWPQPGSPDPNSQKPGSV